MNNVANSWWMYLLGFMVFAFVLITSFAFIFRSSKQAKEIGMDKSVIKKTVITSVVFSLLPSISVLIGVIALSGTLGIPLPWIRLSVIGAIHYEQTAVAAANPSGIPLLAEMTPQAFVTTATVMTLFILSGPLFCLFAFKKYDQKLLSKAKNATDGDTLKDEQVPKKKKSFGPYLFSAAFIALVSSFIAEDIAKMKNITKIGSDIIDKKGKVIGTYSAINTYTPLVVIVVSFSCMALFSFVAKKTKSKWLDDFALGFSMLLGMTSAILVELVTK